MQARAALFCLLLACLFVCLLLIILVFDHPIIKFSPVPFPFGRRRPPSQARVGCPQRHSLRPREPPVERQDRVRASCPYEGR